MKALVGAFNQEKALVGAFSVIVQPVVEPMDRFTALIVTSIVTSLISPHQTAEGGRRAGYWYRWRSRDWGQPSTGVGAGTVVASIALLNISKLTSLKSLRLRKLLD